MSLSSSRLEPELHIHQTSAMIRFEAVSKHYGETRAVSDIDIDLVGGSTTALVGPSGCGKSTLLRLASGLVRPDAGTMVVLDTPLDDTRVTSLRRRMGYVIQEGGLFPHLTARANVSLMAKFIGWTQEQIDTRIADLTALVHLTPDLLARHPDALSGGQRQRVSLIRALMLDPDLLLLDEPLGALDPMVRYDLQIELKRIFESLGKTVLLVTHDIAEAAMLADDVVLLREGRVVQRGTIAELAENPVDPFVTEFLQAHRGPADALQAALS